MLTNGGMPLCREKDKGWTQWQKKDY